MNARDKLERRAMAALREIPSDLCEAILAYIRYLEQRASK